VRLDRGPAIPSRPQLDRHDVVAFPDQAGRRLAVSSQHEDDKTGSG
jgi:hypothetical protein